MSKTPGMSVSSEIFSETWAEAQSHSVQEPTKPKSSETRSQPSPPAEFQSTPTSTTQIRPNIKNPAAISSETTTSPGSVRIIRAASASSAPTPTASSSNTTNFSTIRTPESASAGDGPAKTPLFETTSSATIEYNRS